MSARPFDASLLAARLRERVPTLRLVGMRADYAGVRALSDFPAPCAYVVLAVERPIKTKTGMSLPGEQRPLAQQLQVSLGVVMAFRNYRGVQGDELRDDLRDQVGAVRDQLLGWTPPVDGGAQLQLEGGDLDDYDAATALWIDRYQTQHIVKPEISA